MRYFLLEEQLKYLFASIIFGVITGGSIRALYHFPKAVKQLIKSLRLAVYRFDKTDKIRNKRGQSRDRSSVKIFLYDVLICIVLSQCYQLLSFVYYDGIIRWFSIAGAAAGFVVSYFTIGRFVSSVLDFLFNRVIWLVERIIIIIGLPTRMLVCLCIKAVKPILLYLKYRKRLALSRRLLRAKLLEVEKNIYFC